MAGDNDTSLKSFRELEYNNAKLSAQLKFEQQKRKQAEKELEHAQSALDMLITTQDKVTARRIEAEAKRVKKGTAGNATAVILASDWHIGAVVDPEEVDHCNEYNLEIAQQRTDRFWQKAIKLLDFCQNISHITDICLWLGGDMGNGSLFRPELAETNELGPAEEVLVVQDMLASGIEFLRKETKLPILVPTSNGNHARTEKDKRAHGAYNHSLEHIIYSNLARKFSGTPNLKFKIEKGIHNWVTIRGFDLCFQHGDTLKYSGGVGGFTIPLKRAIGRLSQRRKASCWCLGHVHQFMQDWNFAVNGSLIGYDPFAMSVNAEWQPPVQTFMIVGPPYGKLLGIPIFCEDIEEATKGGKK